MSAQPAGPLSVPPGPVEYVRPGEMVLSASAQTLSTILGSCVAVCLWEPACGAGGMNHYLLPAPPPGALPSPRYGNVAVPLLIEGLLGLGARRERMEARVFGGARVLGPDGIDHLGARNAELAVDLLRGEGIDVVGGDVGGRRGRRLVFDLATGQVCVRLL